MVNQSKFTLADHFIVHFETNEISVMTENDATSTSKIEPRIMKVLEILVKNSPNVVSREQLIHEVWDNYGGAEDALNQAISHLRKVLSDTDKDNRLIQTVIKKGYQYVGTVKSQHPNTIHKNTDKQSKTKIWLQLAIVVLLIFFFAILYFTINKKEAAAPFVPKPDKELPADMPVMAPESE